MLQAVGSQENILEKHSYWLSYPHSLSTLPRTGLAMVVPGCFCLHAGCQVQRQDNMCPEAADSTPHVVLYMTWESFPEDF